MNKKLQKIEEKINGLMEEADLISKYKDLARFGMFGVLTGTRKSILINIEKIEDVKNILDACPIAEKDTEIRSSSGLLDVACSSITLNVSNYKHIAEGTDSISVNYEIEDGTKVRMSLPLRLVGEEFLRVNKKSDPYSRKKDTIYYKEVSIINIGKSVRFAGSDFLNSFTVYCKEKEDMDRMYEFLQVDR